MSRTINYNNIGLGWTQDGYRVVARIEIDPANPERLTQFIDHSTGPTPERVSVSYTVRDMRHPRNGYELSGQVPPEDRVITTRADADASPELEAFINHMWERWHLNDAHAACAHMTPAMLNPDTDTLAAYVAEHPGADRYGQAVQSYRLDNVRCPETGYKYGSAWLAETVDPDDLAQFRALIPGLNKA